jgi:hypothetical protein
MRNLLLIGLALLPIGPMAPAALDVSVRDGLFDTQTEGALSATVDFTPCVVNGAVNGDPIKLTVTATDGATYKQGFHYTGSGPQLITLRELILVNMTDSGWKVKKGTGDGVIVVEGHIGAGRIVFGPTKVSASCSLGERNQPTWTLKLD